MACRLLIGLTKRSPDFDRTLFDKPLSDLPFREYSIDPSWQSKAIPLTPLFAASIPDSQDEVLYIYLWSPLISYLILYSVL